MAKGTRGLWVIGIIALGLARACGGDSDDGGSGGKAGSGGSGGSDASSGGGSAGAGGSSGGASGGGGTSATGGTGGATGGAGGTGGAPPVPCAPPTDPTKAAVCIQLAPEPMKFLPTDPKLDGKGVLVVELFDQQKVETADGGTIPALAAKVFPAPAADGGQGEDTLANLTAQPIRFDGVPMPSSVYARAIFVDDTSLLSNPLDFPFPGVWIAGIDLSSGIAKNLPLLPVTAAAGQGTGATLKLWALRKLSVQVSKAAGLAPKGNGQGPLSALVTDKSQLTSTSAVFGIGSLPCADVSGTQKPTVNGILIGTGPYWLTAVLDDFGVGANDLTGALAALEVTGGGPKIPAKNQLSYPADAYVVLASVELSIAFDPADGGSDSVTCSSADAGTD